MSNLLEKKHRVSASVYFTNHVKRGVHQVAFPYKRIMALEIINLVVYGLKSPDSVW